MLILPAIDILGGRCARLYQGRFDRAQVYADDPVAVAQAWAEAGARWVHVVDLDAARTGQPVNLGVVAAIVRSVGAAVQYGGGVRSLDRVAELLDLGVGRVVVGTAAFTDPDFLAEACRRFGDRIAVALDVRDGQVAVSGWESALPLGPVPAIGRLAAVGVRRLVLTDVGRDGTLEGVNLDLVREVLRAAAMPVIVGGGVGSLGDLIALKALGVEGVILGRALYEGRVDLRAALACGAD